MITRKLGKFLRGKATPFQIISATLLGGLAGAVPGVSQSPLLYLALFCAVVILNANLFLAAISFLVIKLLTLLLLPVLFHAGVWMLEGPLASPIALFVNAPVFAWFGLDYYVTVPSLLLGGGLGIVVGILINRSLRNFRAKMAQMETGSERYQQFASKRSVKVTAWLLFGGLKGKQSWEELSHIKGAGLPVRPLGIVFVLSLIVVLTIGYKLLDSRIITHYARSGMEQANGATVDLEALEIEATTGRVVLRGLALADPENLMQNRFVADEIVMSVSGMNLLAKKVVLDEIQIANARTGVERRVAGKLTVPREKPVAERDLPDIAIDDYLGQAEAIRERLATFKRLYDRLAPYLDKEAEEEVAPDVTISWKDRLLQRAEELGYAGVQSDTLVRGSPRLLIRVLGIDRIEAGGGHVFAVSASNLSTQPVLAPAAGEINLEREDGRLSAQMRLPSLESPATSGIEVTYRDWAIDELAAQVGRDLPMSGGTMNVTGTGTIDSGLLDLPLTVTLFKTTITAFGSSLPVDNFPLQVRIYGPLESPRLELPEDAIEEAIKSGGRRKIESLIEDKAGDSLRKVLPFGRGGD